MVISDLKIEKSLWGKGHKYIVGIDEVGRGSWAGPLVVGGVIFPQDVVLPQGLADSKLVKPQARTKLAKIIKTLAASTLVVEVAPSQINKIGIGKATQVAFRKIANTIKPIPDFCVIDAFYIKYFNRKKQMAVKDGDKICASISAASIIAKVYRDNLMKRFHFKYPGYGFGKHKGYGTKKHQEAIRRYGFCKIHRISYDLSFLFESNSVILNEESKVRKVLRFRSG